MFYGFLAIVLQYAIDVFRGWMHDVLLFFSCYFLGMNLSVTGAGVLPSSFPIRSSFMSGFYVLRSFRVFYCYSSVLCIHFNFVSLDLHRKWIIMANMLRYYISVVWLQDNHKLLILNKKGKKNGFDCTCRVIRRLSQWCRTSVAHTTTCG